MPKTKAIKPTRKNSRARARAHTKNKPGEWERDDANGLARKMERKNRFRERTERKSRGFQRISHRARSWRNDPPSIVRGANGQT